MPSIAILTFAVGADYKKAMEPGMASKREYAKRHGYTFLEGGEDVWDRTRPIPWSKIRFILKYLNEYDYLFWSDGDVIIANPDLCLEEHVLPLLPADKDMLWCRDACGNLNNGNVLFRGKSVWGKDFLERCYAQEDLKHHIWWDNAAFCRLFESNPGDKQRIETCLNPRQFNSYIFSRADKADDLTADLYKPGDFLVHFAGVYDMWNIHRCMLYIKFCTEHSKVPDTNILNEWRKSPPINKDHATESLQNIF